MILKDIINDQFECLMIDDNIEKAVKIFSKYKLAMIPIVDKNKKLLGIFTRSRFLKTLLQGVSLKEPITPYINEYVFSLRGDTSFEEVSRIVKNSDVGAAPVVDNTGRVLGVLTKQNFILALLKQAQVLNLYFEADFEKVAKEMETVKKLNNTFDTVLKNIYDGIIVVDERGNIIFSNQAISDFLNLSPQYIIGKHLTKIFPYGRLHITAKTGIPEIADIQIMNDRPMIVSRIPITKERKVLGAVGKITFPQLPQIQELADKVVYLQNKVAYYKQELENNKTIWNIVTKSKIMDKIMLEAKQVAKNSSTVLITGESGTGKELVAKAIHSYSDRKNGPFIKINCGAIPENLLEAELFGYVPGAFTGASIKGKPGRFELADKGTIFLDEIGGMPLSLQVKLLRVIQEREFERLGDIKTRKINVRIIAAANIDLKRSVSEGTFRADLYYRLNVIELHLPPLRERPEDIEILVEHFINKYNRLLNVFTKGIAPEAMAILQKYNWPGNIRELENVIERALNYNNSEYLQLENLPDYIINNFCCEDVKNEGENKQYFHRMTEVEKEIILSALRQTQGNKTIAAKMLNISRSRLYVKMKKHGIK